MLDLLVKNGAVIDGLGGPPSIRDIAVKDGKIVDVDVGISAFAKETMDATGKTVTPGFIDIHTHYDGQVSWDDQLDPSASHGVTTAVMGNCGVGFAPVRPGEEKELIEVMEGVEDIPGTALYEGIEWGKWESFPEYLDYLGRRKFALDVGAQIPHAALRNYVMGASRAREAATQKDIDQMASLIEEALDAGAVGFSTSRTIGHRSMDGVPIPGTFAADEEVLAFAEAMRRADKGVFELIPGSTIGELAALGGEAHTVESEITLLDKVSKASGRPVTFTLLQNSEAPQDWRQALDRISDLNANGARLYPQVASRPIGLVTSLRTYHLFERRPTFLELSKLSFSEMLSELKKPNIRARILSEKDVPTDNPGSMSNAYKLFRYGGPKTFELLEPIDYEPTPDLSFAARADANNQSLEEFSYDFLTSGDGDGFAILLSSNFHDYNFDAIRSMLTDPNTVTGLSDAGAHVNMIFDGVAPTYQMTHWSRDRTRGERLPLEFIVSKQTKRNADLYGFNDRGSLEPGKRADINVFDFSSLRLGKLELKYDLPAGGSRILQPASGYEATYVDGVKTRSNDADTGARPGGVLRV